MMKFHVRPDSLLIDVCEQLYFKVNLKLRKETTRYQYRLAIATYGYFLGHDALVNDLTDDSVSLWMRELLNRDLSSTTIRERAGRVGALWNWLARRREVDVFPTFSKPDKAESLPIALTERQLSALFHSAAKERGEIAGIPAALWWTSFLAFIWNTGERKSATLAVRCEWLDFDRQYVVIPAHVRKGGRKHGVYRLWPETMPLLRAVVMVDPARDLVWPWDRNEGCYYTSYDRILRDAGIPVNRKYKTHALRCTHATMKLVLGGDPTRALGHIDAATTHKHYIDPTMLPPDTTPMFIPWQVPAAVPTIPTQPALAPEPKKPTIAEEVAALAWL